MYNRDGTQRVGRFIKKSNTRLMDCVRLSKFDFEEISVTDVTTLDNPTNNVLHARFHPGEELSKSVVPPKGFDESLIERNLTRPILVPLDFTEDWVRQQSRRSQRSARGLTDDDEYLDAEIEEQLTGGLIDEDEESSDQDEKKTSTEKPSEETQGSVQENEGEPPASSFQQDLSNIDVVGKVIKTLSEGESEAEDAEATDEVQETPPPSSSEEFVPTVPEAVADSDVSEPPPTEAVEPIQPGGTPAEPSFDEGFAKGEQEARQAVKEQAERLFGQVEQMLGELTSLKKKVLTSVEQNFYELAQAVSESLLRRELAMNPSAFREMLEKAVEEVVPDDEFKIMVHPQYLSQLKELGVPQLEGKLVPDESVKIGDFRIDTNFKVVEGDLRERIEDLIKNTDIKLFKDDDKAG